MTTLTKLSTSFLAGKTLVIHLRANREGNPVEISGAGYKPVELSGESRGNNIRYPDANFVFTGALGWVYGFYATIDGERVECENEIFDKPFYVGGKGFRIIIPMSAEAK